MFRLAHVSDLHVMAPAGVQLRRVLFNKRVTGYANLLTQRARVYRQERLLAVLAEAARQSDHLVVTGDITNLSLEGEYEEARRLLDQVTRQVEVSVIPGNHDIYLPATLRERRFPHHFASFMHSDLPQLALPLPAGHYPYVKLRGPTAIIGLSSAVPRPPFVSAGYLGRAQLEALSRVLAHPEVARRLPVVLVHHSPFDSRLKLEQLRGGLVDAHALREALRRQPRGLVLYGHLHLRSHRPLGGMEAACASAASLEHPDDRIRSGFNLYQVEEDGALRALHARVLDPSRQRFEQFELRAAR